MRLPESSYSSSELSLVLGVDGSGKTSFMNAVAETTGAVVLEPTSSQKARDFKRSTLNQPITPDLVTARELLFTELNRDFDVSIQETLGRTNVLTSGSLLVTRLSHFAMRATISSPQETTPSEIVDEWLIEARHAPEKIVFLHAPGNVIRGRLLAREMSGDTSERPLGYNSPFFLDRYNNALESAVLYLSANSSDRVFNYDTSLESTADIVDDFLST